MNKVILQIWEESNINHGVLTNGCSIHLNKHYKDAYIKNKYSKRNEYEIPDRYDRVVGESTVVYVNDEIYDLVKLKKSIKLSQVEFSNLRKLEDIIYNPSTI